MASTSASRRSVEHVWVARIQCSREMVDIRIIQRPQPSRRGRADTAGHWKSLGKPLRI
jgi:hypothetical protein